MTSVSLCSTLSQDLVFNNMEVLSNLQPNQKIVLYPQTGEIKFEDRYAQTFRRKAFGGSDTVCIEKTLKDAVTIIQTTPVVGKEFHKNCTVFKIYKLYLKVIKGIQTLAATYKTEGKSEISKSLEKIASDYLTMFSQLPDLEKSLMARKIKKRKPAHRPLKLPQASQAASSSASTSSTMAAISTPPIVSTPTTQAEPTMPAQASSLPEETVQEQPQPQNATSNISQENEPQEPTTPRLTSLSLEESTEESNEQEDADPTSTEERSEMPLSSSSLAISITPSLSNSQILDPMPSSISSSINSQQLGQSEHLYSSFRQNSMDEPLNPKNVTADEENECALTDMIYNFIRNITF